MMLHGEYGRNSQHLAELWTPSNVAELSRNLFREFRDDAADYIDSRQSRFRRTEEEIDHILKNIFQVLHYWTFICRQCAFIKIR